VRNGKVALPFNNRFFLIRYCRFPHCTYIKRFNCGLAFYFINHNCATLFCRVSQLNVSEIIVIWNLFNLRKPNKNCWYPAVLSTYIMSTEWHYLYKLLPACNSPSSLREIRHHSRNIMTSSSRKKMNTQILDNN